MLMALISCQTVGIDGEMSAVKLNSIRENCTMHLVGVVGDGWAWKTLSGYYWELQVFFPHMIKAGHLFFVKCLQKQLFSKRFKEM
jgi:hypothetical protein